MNSDRVAAAWPVHHEAERKRQINISRRAGAENLWKWSLDDVLDAFSPSSGAEPGTFPA